MGSNQKLLPIFDIKYRLEREIFVVIFGKVQSLWLWRNPLTGVITELHALSAGWHDSFFGAENLILVNLCTVLAVGAVRLDLLSEKHSILPRIFFFTIIQHYSSECYLFFSAAS